MKSQTKNIDSDENDLIVIYNSLSLQQLLCFIFLFYFLQETTLREYFFIQIVNFVHLYFDFDPKVEKISA